MQMPADNQQVVQEKSFSNRKIGTFAKKIPFWILIIGFLGLVFGMMFVVFLSAFGKESDGLFGGITLEWFKRAWLSYDVGQFFLVTVQVLFTATIISLVLSIPTAYILARKDFPFKNLLVSFFQLPFTLPELVYAIPIASIFYSMGLAETIPGLVLVYLIIGVPFSVFILIPFIESLDPRLEFAAYSLGANKFKLFTKIIVPQLVPGITAAAINIFVRMFGAFTLILLIAGPTTQTLPVMVFSVLRSSGSQPQPMLDALALTLMVPLLLFSVLSIWLSSYAQRRMGK